MNGPHLKEGDRVRLRGFSRGGEPMTGRIVELYRVGTALVELDEGFTLIELNEETRHPLVYQNILEREPAGEG